MRRRDFLKGLAAVVGVGMVGVPTIAEAKPEHFIGVDPAGPDGGHLAIYVYWNLSAGDVRQVLVALPDAL